MDKRVAVISLGCDKNRVDTETMLYNLNACGYTLTNDLSEAQVIIVNTCAFILSAREEAIDTIIQVAQYKKGSCEKLIVTGCLPQKYGDQLSELTEVDAFLGIYDYPNICNVISSLYGYINQVPLSACDYDMRIRTTPAHYAYLKIADGCDNKCTFCNIPSIRGKFRSKSIESLILEAKDLYDDGVKEIILVAQDVTAYGVDIGTNLITLLRELSKIDFLWIRLLYCYPEKVTDELLCEIDCNPKIAKYVDIPLQHVSNGVLKRMNRKSTHEGIVELFNKIRALKNHVAIRTTIMTGFPGETEQQFEEACEFIKDYAPDHVGIFAYSKEEDTPSYKLKGHITKSEKLKRVNKLGKIHFANVLAKNKRLVNTVQKVLYEDIDFDRNAFVGRTQYSSPDIDTKVYFTGEFADVGNVYDVKITAVDGYDLVGEIINE